MLTNRWALFVWLPKRIAETPIIAVYLSAAVDYNRLFVAGIEYQGSVMIAALSQGCEISPIVWGAKRMGLPDSSMKLGDSRGRVSAGKERDLAE